jgi:hypothetical protein
MVEGNLWAEDGVGQGFGGALWVLVPPAVLVLGVGAGGCGCLELFRVQGQIDR